MLTINIEDNELEQCLLHKAEANGKSVEQLVREMVARQLGKPDKLNFEIPRLDVREHARVIDNVLTAEEEAALAENPDVKPFSHIKDSAKYIHDLRRKPRY